MDWTCPVCGKTFKRSKQAHKCFSGGSPELSFPGGKAKWLPLYQALLKSVQARVPFICDYAPSGGAQWRRRSIFASMHGESAGLYVNFFANHYQSDIKLLSVTPLSANRLQHVVAFADEAKIPEMAELIVTSYFITEQDGK